MYGHLKPGLQPKTASQDLDTLAHQLSETYRSLYPKQFDVQLESLGDIAAGRIKSSLYTLLAAVGLLLLIACANVANLLLAKAKAREKELALRFVLGASRWRIVRQLMVESALLAFAAAAAGCVLAVGELRCLIALLPIYTFPDEAVIDLNTSVLLATVATAIATAFIFGLAPALAAARNDLNEPLKTGGRGNTGFRRGHLRDVLVIGEVALSLMLLTGAGLLMHSFFLQRSVDLGIRADHILTTGLNLPAKRYPTADSQVRFVRDLLPHIENLPGVVSVAAALDLPPNGGAASDFDVAGITHSERWTGDMVPCTWQFFETLRLRVVSGRQFTSVDEDKKRKVAVINQTMAGKYFGRENPIGRQLQLSGLTTASDPWFEIIGVVTDVKNRGVRNAVVPEAYFPYTVAAFGGYQFHLFVRTATNPNTLSAALTGAVLTADREIIPRGTIALDEALETSQYARPRFSLILFSVFAAVGLLLVSIGVYSVISYAVAQQRREIGIRMALGASKADVRSIVLGTGLRFILLGVGIGVPLSFLVGRALASQIWGVSWFDPMTLIGVVIVLTAVGIAASYLPSRRAMRVDPSISLRYE